MREMSFRGQSGRAYQFIKMAKDAPWARERGVALFAARGPFGWRVVKLAQLRGRAHDIQPIWAFADAERYGATAVFVSSAGTYDESAHMVADLEAGLSPVCESVYEDTKLAA